MVNRKAVAATATEGTLTFVDEDANLARDTWTVLRAPSWRRDERNNMAEKSRRAPAISFV